MKTPDALISWFDEQLDTLPTDDSIATLNALVEDPPIGISTVKLLYSSIPLHKSGPKGWTYFPADADGTRLARMSCSSKVRGVPVTAMVKLFRKPFSSSPETDLYTISDYAIVTIDNLSCHGCVEYRETNPKYKRRKLQICH
jgi:hypothetical protein